METISVQRMPFQGIGSRSFGSKLFVLMLLAALMSLSGIFVDNLASERAERYGLRAFSEGASVQAPSTVLGIRLADSYRSTRRSLHYIPLFLGLVFLTYFLFEVTTGKRVHPAQYALVGTAQLVFYLLLLSLAEKIGFDLSFLLAGGSTVALFSINTEWVFGERRLAKRAAVVFAALYAFIYVLLRIEAYALLVGAVGSFAAVSLAMFLTRHLDWYRSDAPVGGLAGAAGVAGATPVQRDSWLD